MRIEVSYVLNGKFLREALGRLGYAVLYDSDTELDVKKPPYHFIFNFKRRGMVVRAHVDHGHFHHHCITKSKELEEEYVRIMDENRKIYFEKKDEIPEQVVLCKYKNEPK